MSNKGINSKDYTELILLMSIDYKVCLQEETTGVLEYKKILNIAGLDCKI